MLSLGYTELVDWLTWASWAVFDWVGSHPVKDSSVALDRSTLQMAMVLQTLTLVFTCDSIRLVNQTCQCFEHSGISCLDVKLQETLTLGH